MEYIYAAMLLHKAGKEISEASLTQVLTAVLGRRRYDWTTLLGTRANNAFSE